MISFKHFVRLVIKNLPGFFTRIFLHFQLLSEKRIVTPADATTSVASTNPTIVLARTETGMLSEIFFGE